MKQTDGFDHREFSGESRESRIETGLVEILQNLAPVVLDFFQKDHVPRTKEDDSIVTEADTAVEEILRQKLSELLPDSYFLGEENSDMDSDAMARIFEHEYIWCVDPIDGTSNFAKGEPHFAVSIGLLKKTKYGHSPVCGAVLFPALNELLFTKEGKSYFMNIDTKEARELYLHEESSNIFLVSKSFDNNFIFQGEKGDEEREIQKAQLGSIVVNVAFTTLGRCRATLTGAHIWDFMGGMAVAHNVGIEMRRLSDGTEKKTFTAGDFIMGDKKKDWRLKEPFLFVRPGDFEIFKERIEKK